MPSGRVRRACAQRQSASPAGRANGAPCAVAAAGAGAVGDLDRGRRVRSAVCAAALERWVRACRRGRGGGAGSAVGSASAAAGRSCRWGSWRVGRGGRLRQLPPAPPRVCAHRVVYAHAGGVLEWYAAGPLGIEQGFTLSAAAGGCRGRSDAGARPFGGLRATDGRVRGGVPDAVGAGGAALRRAGGARCAWAARLRAWLSLSGRRLLVRVADRGARYPLLIDPLIQQGPKLTASDESGEGQFGYSVAVSADGTTALVGGSATTATRARRGCSRAPAAPGPSRGRS